MTTSRFALMLRRTHVLLGMRGYAGLTMALIAMLASAWAWQMHRNGLALGATRDQLVAPLPAPSAFPAVAPVKASLPYRRDQTALLRDIETSAQKFHLAWTKVDYGHQPLSDERLAALEIKGVMRGPYPAVRDFLAEVLTRQPATALRGLVLTRDAPESGDVEARISLSLFMADGWLVPTLAPTSAPIQSTP